MRQYEFTYLISDDVQESEITKITGKIGGIIADQKGKVLKEESWGRRKLAYPIRKQLFATYITINFELEPENLKNIERDLRHENPIVRYLLIVKEFGKEKLSLSTEDIAATKEIKEVVGGEKSFEAVEGETEESKNLMAVRGEAKMENTSDKKSDLGSGLGRDGQDTSVSARPSLDGNKPQIASSRLIGGQTAIAGETITKSEENDKNKAVKAKEVKEEPIEIKKEPKEIAEEKPVSEKPKTAEKPAKKTIKKTEDKKAVIASEAKQSNVKKIATVKDSLLPAIRLSSSKSGRHGATTDDNEPKEIARKPIKKKAIKKDSTASDEADRLAKLDEELDEILGEDL